MWICCEYNTKTSLGVFQAVEPISKNEYITTVSVLNLYSRSAAMEYCCEFILCEFILGFNRMCISTLTETKRGLKIQ